MLGVNSEKVLQDLKELADKRSQKLDEIEQAAREFAISRGYDEERTEKFVKFAQENEDNGLSVAEKAKLDMLCEYVYEVAEQPDDSADESAEAIAEAENVETVNQY